MLVRVEVKREGGFAHFPGLSRPVVVDTTQLPEEEARELEQLVQTARFFELSSALSEPRKGAADYRQYTITVHDAGRSHTVRLADPVQDAAIQSLIRLVNAKARARK